MIPFWDIITSVSCYFAGELFKLFSLWPAKRLQAEKNHAKLCYVFPAFSLRTTYLLSFFFIVICSFALPMFFFVMKHFIFDLFIRVIACV